MDECPKGGGSSLRARGEWSLPVAGPWGPEGRDGSLGVIGRGGVGGRLVRPRRGDRYRYSVCRAAAVRPGGGLQYFACCAVQGAARAMLAEQLLCGELPLAQHAAPLACGCVKLDERAVAIEHGLHRLLQSGHPGERLGLAGVV